MAINWTTLDTAIKAWLDGQVPTLTWYRAQQDVPAQPVPFGVWDWTSRGRKSPTQGELPDDRHMVDEDERQVLHHRRHTLQINAFSASTVGNTDAVAYLETVRDSLELEAVRVALDAAGMVLVPIGGVRDITALLPDRGESRAVLEITVYTVDSVTEDVGSIQTAEITPTLVT